jgi:hypothetical protein
MHDMLEAAELRARLRGWAQITWLTLRAPLTVNGERACKNSDVVMGVGKWHPRTSNFARGALRVCSLRVRYWTDTLGVSGPPSGAVWMANLDGSAPTPILTAQGSPAGIAADDTEVYWTNLTDGTVMGAKIHGGLPAAVAVGQNAPGALALDANYVYWSASNSVLRVPR